MANSDSPAVPSIVAFRIRLPASDEDAVTALLWEHGTLGVELSEAASDELAMLAYFPAVSGLEQELREELAGMAGIRIEPAAVAEIDWAARFREGFRARRAGSFLIAPCWDVPASADRSRLLVVDPGRAFGTGTHESTRLCLAALESLPVASCSWVLDVGAGTAILAIAAARLGARRVVACDIDPEATQAARRHAEINGVPLDVVRADAGKPFRPAAFDLVLANLTSQMLVERSGEIRALAGPHGMLVLSGFLLEEQARVREAYLGFGETSLLVEDEWAAAVVRRGPGGRVRGDEEPGPFPAPQSPRHSGGTAKRGGRSEWDEGVRMGRGQREPAALPRP